MRAVVQRVARAEVTVDGEPIARIDRGLVALVGVAGEDTADDAVELAQKIAGLRVFADSEGKMNLDVAAIGGAVLVVSQFTLLGDCRKGRRPSFVDAAPPDRAEALYEQVAAELRTRGLIVATGRFRADMQVALVNDGPVTLLLDTRKQF